MKNIFHNFFADKNLFFDLIDSDVSNMVKMAKTLVAVANTDDLTERERFCSQINRLENTGDDITHKIHLYLDKFLFTPLNRNDIHALASTIDDVADMIKETGGRIYLYNIDNIMPPIKEIAVIVLNATLEIEKAVNMLRHANNTAVVIDVCRNIKTFKREANQIYYRAVAALFSDNKDTINVIKYREILASLEDTTHKCKNAADALETILINR